MALANAGVSLALAALLCRPTIKLLNAAIELLDFFFARKLAPFRGWPGSFVKPGEDEMRPLLPLCLGDGQEVYASVGMIASRVAFQTETRSDLFQPSQVQSSREIDLNLLGPVPTSARNLQPVLLPTQSPKRVLSRMEEIRKAPARREKLN